MNKISLIFQAEIEFHSFTKLPRVDDMKGALDTSRRRTSTHPAVVNVKWGKQLFKGVEIQTDLPTDVFKEQLFSLTEVPPERQKGALLFPSLPFHSLTHIKII